MRDDRWFRLGSFVISENIEPERKDPGYLDGLDLVREYPRVYWNAEREAYVSTETPPASAWFGAMLFAVLYVGMLMLAGAFLMYILATGKTPWG